MSTAKTPMGEPGNLLARFRAFVTSRREERGALSNALLLVLVVTTLLIVSMSWFFFRQTLDYTTAQQAQVRSSVNQLATNVLGQMNSDFPKEWQYMNSTELKKATAQFGNTPELGATSYITFFAVNPNSGVVTAEMEGKSANGLSITAKARVQFVPSGAGVFTGLDKNGRPVWVYSDDNLDALALWELNPNSIEYLTPGGDYTSVAPPVPPTVSITASGNTVTSSFSAVYCQYGGDAEYRYRFKMGTAAFGSWSEWSTDQSFSRSINQGQKISVQAMARCRTTLGVTDPTAASAIAEYTHPIEPPPAAPKLSLNTDGIASWTAVSCGTGTTAEYQSRVRLNEGTWTAWTSWADGVLSSDTNANQGARVEFQVRARCASEFATGNQTATASAQIDLPITSRPAEPTMSIGGTSTITTSVSSASSVTGLTAEYRYRIRVNGGNTWTYNAWSTTRIDTRTVNQGSKVEAQGQVRYVSPYVDGGGSPESDIKVLNVPVTTRPDSPTLTITDDYSQVTIGQVDCPAGTTPRYTWLMQINGVTRETYENISPQNFTRNTPVPEGGSLRMLASAACLGTGTGLYGPSSSDTGLWRVRPVTAAPTTPVISFATNGAPSWVKGGCGTGTSWQSRSRVQTNAGGWSSWSGWDGLNSISSPIGQGERVQVNVQARCISTSDETLSGPWASDLSDWFTYEITATPTVGGKVVISGEPATAVFTNPTNCPAATSVRVSSRVGSNDTWYSWSAFSTERPDHEFSTTNGNVARAQLQARCVSSYSTGPTYSYNAVSFTTPIREVPGSPTVSWNTTTWDKFSFTSVSCSTGLTAQYRYRTKSGLWSDKNEGGWSRAWSAWGGNPGTVTFDDPWIHGDFFDVQVATRCVNSYSNAVGPSLSYPSQAKDRGMPQGPVVHIAYNDAILNSSWAPTSNYCPTGTVTEYSSYQRVNWDGDAFKEPSSYESGWTDFSTTHKSRKSNAEEGRSQKTYVRSQCVNPLTGARGAERNQSTLGGTNGFYIRAVSAGSKWAGRVSYRYYNHGINCRDGAWASDPYLWVMMNTATSSGWNGPYWEYNNQGGDWGNVEYNSRAVCAGPYANGGYQWAGGTVAGSG